MAHATHSIPDQFRFVLSPYVSTENMHADAISAIELKTNKWQCGGDACCHKIMPGKFSTQNSFFFLENLSQAIYCQSNWSSHTWKVNMTFVCFMQNHFYCFDIFDHIFCAKILFFIRMCKCIWDLNGTEWPRSAAGNRINRPLKYSLWTSTYLLNCVATVHGQQKLHVCLIDGAMSNFSESTKGNFIFKYLIFTLTTLCHFFFNVAYFRLTAKVEAWIYL